MVESRLLQNSISFGDTADDWAKNRGLLNEEGEIVSGFPIIIGMPEGSTDLGAFNFGIIQNNRTIKSALQDLETATNSRLVTTNNLSDVPNKTTARTNLGLGSGATWNVGTSGATIPLLNTANTWSAKQTFNAQLVVSGWADINSSAGTNAVLSFGKDTSYRWHIGKDSTAESGSNTGADFFINRFDDAGNFINTVFKIVRSTGAVHLSTPLPVASGGTGASTLAGLKTTLGLENVNNTSDANKPISTATQTALDGKLDKIGGTVSGSLYATGIISSTNEVRATNSDGTRSVQITNNGGIELVNPAGPYLDFKTLQTQDYLGRLSYNPTQSRLEILSNNGFVVTATTGEWPLQVISSSNVYNVCVLQNKYMNSSRIGHNNVDMLNENGVQYATISGKAYVDGSSDLFFQISPAGSRTIDKRSTVMTLTPSSINCTIPINGRAYPRKADGANINFNWSGQAGQPGWVWGGENGTDMYVYNPSNFNVNYASTSGTANYANRVSYNADNGTSAVLVYGNMARDDSFRILIGGSDNAGYAEIATADDGNEPIYVRQYTGPFTSIARTATLLDNNGNTSFPGGLSAWNITANSQFHTNGWYRSWSDSGLYWDNRGRGLTVADNGAAFGQVNVTGVGANSWHGYSIHNYASFMGNSDTVGIHSQQRGTWLVSWDTGANAVFPQNITAYSDERLKENKRPIDNVTQRRKGMARAAIIYERDGRTRFGFGAQTLELSNPEVVFTADDLIGTKSVNYMDTVAVLAVDNDNLDARITQLENENQRLKKMVKDLYDKVIGSND